MSNIIEIKDLSFKYEKDNVILDNITTSFKKGRIIALIGRNGSGKTTLLDCLLGTNEYDGNILINKINMRDLSSNEFAKMISYIPQNTQINIDYTIRDIISFGRNPYVGFGMSLTGEDNKKIEANAEKCGISNLLEKDINKVSGGERQLAFIARALTQETPIIIMDEPTAALDFGNQQRLFRIMNILAKEGKTIIFTTHNPNHLINLDCDIYAIINKKIVSIVELDNETIKFIYGEEFCKEGKYFLFKI